MSVSQTQIDRTERNLKGVHPDLVKVYRAAAKASKLYPVITCGKRTVAEQKILVANGASKTMNSRHIPGSDGFAKAIDVVFIIDGKARWDWPLFKTFADLMKAAGGKLGIPVTWGGDWKSFKDGPHFELPAKLYP